jgi:hypothetical protein
VHFQVFKAVLAVPQSTVEMCLGERLDNPGADQYGCYIGQDDPEFDIGRRA